MVQCSDVLIFWHFLFLFDKKRALPACNDHHFGVHLWIFKTLTLLNNDHLPTTATICGRCLQVWHYFAWHKNKSVLTVCRLWIHHSIILLSGPSRWTRPQWEWWPWSCTSSPTNRWPSTTRWPGSGWPRTFISSSLCPSKDTSAIPSGTIESG